MLRSAFGDRVDSLIELQGLVTAPESQGHGYGTALMHFANALADAQGRGVYIFTTEAYTFYETVGYTVVEEDVLGKDNPKWAGDPVHIRIWLDNPSRTWQPTTTWCLTHSQWTNMASDGMQELEKTPLLRRGKHAPQSDDSQTDPGRLSLDIMPMSYGPYEATAIHIPACRTGTKAYSTLAGEIFRGADTIHRAFVDNNMMRYYSSVDTAPFYDTRWRIRHTLTLLDTVHQRRTVTIGHGASLLQYSAPGNDQNSGWYNAFFRAWEVFNTRELTKRKAETRELTGSIVQQAFGEKVKDMYSIEILATAPEAQGRGYASALVNAVVEMAAAEGRDVWLVSSDSWKFYERLGFVLVNQADLGADNPEWHEEPVTLHILYKDNSSAGANHEA
ncbi:hypothetical protein BN946_scf184652.g35 [Trametes cinnabarina]|uniref:N-acetyltransferase domain-containing protein n=1 Tax=Pycnoporus cinnabarinus TaxID=5643 RepID=A0A060S8K0_PYCCI|nr:hypothetical protein BN946_scf184652.g35 [Trametes cinnabarina]